MDSAKAASRLTTFLRAETGRCRRYLQKAGHRNAPGPVHDTRKSIKKLRAALRLADGMAAAGMLDAAAAPLREAAHRLGPLRDALVLDKTSRELLRRGEEALPAAPSPEGPPLLQEVRAQLRSAEVGLRRLMKPGLDPQSLEKSVRRLYRRAREEMHHADKDRTDEALHAWRRRAKDLFYNLDLIQAPSACVKKLKRLTEFLGDDHDLAFFAQHHASPAALETHARLFQRADQKRARLQKKAFHLGEKLFETPPRKFAARLMG